MEEGGLHQLSPGGSAPFFLPLSLCCFQFSDSLFRKQPHQQEGMGVHATLLDLSRCFFNGDFEAAVTGTESTLGISVCHSRFLSCSGLSFPIRHLMGVWEASGGGQFVRWYLCVLGYEALSLETGAFVSALKFLQNLGSERAHQGISLGRKYILSVPSQRSPNSLSTSSQKQTNKTKPLESVHHSSNTRKFSFCSVAQALLCMSCPLGNTGKGSFSGTIL